MTNKDHYLFIPEKYEKILGTWHRDDGVALVVKSESARLSRCIHYNYGKSWLLTEIRELRRKRNNVYIFSYKPLVFILNPYDLENCPEFVPYDL